jgi:uncharacterized Fe-S cluster protein YjdI
MESENKFVKQYKNDEITIVWNPDLCTHIAYCFTELPEVFDPSERPWINPQGATTEKIVEQIKKCPTGALTFFYNDSSKQNDDSQTENDNQTSVKIDIVKNGPAVINGKVEYSFAESGKKVTKEKTFLCRCGKSRNLPWCDGQHLHHKFE